MIFNIYDEPLFVTIVRGANKLIKGYDAYMYLYSYRLISLLLLMYSPLRRLLSLFPPGAQQKRLPAAYRLN